MGLIPGWGIRIPHPEQYVQKKKREDKDKDTNELTYIWNLEKPPNL